jgi:hypothetical protein
VDRAGDVQGWPIAEQGRWLRWSVGGTGAEGDGSEFLNESGEGMEEKQPHESERNDDCEDGSQETGRDLITRSGEVYIYIG